MLQRRIGMIWTSKGWAVSTSPRASSRNERALRPMELSDKSESIASGRGRLDRPEPAHLFADLHRAGENAPDRDEPKNLVACDRGEAGRCQAAAVLAVGCAAELTWGDLRGEIGRDAHRGAREHALVGRAWRLGVGFDQAFRHFQLWIAQAQRK